MRKSLTVLGSVLILTLGGVWIAHATTASEPGTITACAKKPGGALRFSTTGNCRADETKLAWNTAGVPGMDGDDGVSGYEIVRKQGREVATGPTEFIGDSVACPLGKVATGGGANGVGIFTDQNGQQISSGLADIRASFPIEGDANDPAEWLVRFGKSDGTAFAQGQGVDYTLFVMCATVAP